jgi:FkbM family methyltransferase
VLLKIAKRLVEKATKRHFLRLVAEAYDHPNLDSHQRIRRAAQTWYGTTRDGRFKRRCSGVFIEFVYQAQLELFRHGLDRDLGPSPIGFEDLSLHCRSSDANSSVVHLYGFSDNLTHFTLYKSCVRPGSTAIDVGANLGIHSLALSRCVGEKGSVIAYEPSITIHKRLLRNIEENAVSNIFPKRLGLSDRTGSAGFEPHVADFNIGKGKLRDDAAQQIRVTTLDDETRGLAGPIDLIKIDVEGAELSVIKGARKTLVSHRPMMVAEFNPHRYSFEELLDQIPYECRCYRIPNTFWDSLTPIDKADFDQRADVLIAPSDRPPPSDRPRSADRPHPSG